MPKILAIDDKPDNLVTLSALLRNLMPDCAVITALSGREGIGKAAADGPDVVLLDVKMPDMDGFETCRRLGAKEDTKRIPVIMITAVKTDAESRIKGLECGANAFLAKPIDPSELVSQVRVALRIKKAEDELRQERNLLEKVVQERTDSLRRSEERFRLLAENARDTIWTMDMDLRYTYMSPFVKQTLGYTPEEFIAIPWNEVLAPSSLELCLQVLAEELEIEKRSDKDLLRARTIEVEQIHKSGKIVPAEIKLTFIRNEAGQATGILGYTRDVTDRKSAEEEKRRTRERADRLATETAVIAEIGRVIGSSPDIDEVYDAFAAEVKKLILFDSLMINLYERDRDALQIAYVSGLDIPTRRKTDLLPFRGSIMESISQGRQGLLIQGESSEEIGKKYPILTPLLREGWKSLLYVPLVSADHAIGVLVFRSKNETAYGEQDLRLAERIGMQIAGAVANARLFAELKKTEQSLRESEERFRLAYSTSPDAININRMSDGLFVDINEGFTRLTGFTREDVLGKTSLEVDIWCSSSDRRILVQGLQERGYYENLEADFRRQDGSVTTALMSARVIELQGVPHILSITRDIGDRKRIEEENLRLTERLQRAEKMEALGTLAGGVAHDLNNVLGIVVGYAGMLLDDVAGSSPLRSDLMNILTGGERAAAIVQDLLTLARRGVSNRKVLNLSRMVADFQHSPEFKTIFSYHPSVRVKVDIEPDGLNISGSPVHIGKTLCNLISNACEAMPNGGVLTIRTANQYIDKPVQGYDEVREGDYVLLSVSDTGEGIRPEDLQRIFEPFYTKKVMGRSGTGLGLAVVWGTVKDHHGYINVQSEEGRGSVFTVYFPVTREEVTAEQVAVPVSEYMGRGESILVVDDVKGQRELAMAMLRRLNYSVTSVAGGEEAVDWLKDHAADLLVLDMIMDPGMDGLETYRAILKTHPRQRAIIVSGFSESERVNAAQALGAGAYVRKPYVVEKLGLAVRKELDRQLPLIRDDLPPVPAGVQSQ
jgi:PAS domain S-box-containing protein